MLCPPPPPCVQVWSGQNFSLLKTLAGHEGKVMCVDVCPPPPSSHAPHPLLLASMSYDRTIKMWAAEEVPDLMEES